MNDHNIHGRPGTIIYAFNATSKKLHKQCQSLKEAAELIQKPEGVAYYRTKDGRPENGFILSRTEELIEPVQKMF